MLNFSRMRTTRVRRGESSPYVPNSKRCVLFRYITLSLARPSIRVCILRFPML